MILLAAAAEGAKKGGMPQFNPEFFAPQLIWLAITFVLLYLIMSRIALPRIGEVIEERRDRIQRDLDAAERFKGETDKALAAYEKSLADARTKAGGIARETRDKLAAEVEKDRAEVDRQLNAKLADAEARITATKSKAMASVSQIASETAGAVVTQLTGAAPGADEIKAAIAPPPRS